MNTGPVTLLVGVATLGLLAWVAFEMQSAPPPQGAPDAGADRRLAAIERRLGRIEDALGGRAAAGTSGERARPRRVPSADADHGAGASAGGGETAGNEGATAAESVEAVAARFESAVEQRMERLAALQNHRGDDGQWKPPLSVLARELGVDEDRARELRVLFDAVRDETFAVLVETRNDGGNLLDDLAADMAKRGEAAAVGKFFARMTKENVPGRDQTYVQALGDIEQRIRPQIDARLGEAQRKRFEELRVDVFEVETGHDPIGDYVRERLGVDR